MIIRLVCLYCLKENQSNYLQFAHLIQTYIALSNDQCSYIFKMRFYGTCVCLRKVSFLDKFITY